jgi:hypothetical protein
MLKNNWRARRLIDNLYMRQRVNLHLSQGETDSLEIERGVRQGSCTHVIYLTYIENI